MIFFNYSKCSTCIKARKFLENNNMTFISKDAKKDIITKEEIKKWYEISNKDIKKFFNTSGKIYKELNLKEKLDGLSLDEKFELLAKDAMLLKRPLLISNNKVLIGYKEDEWKQELL